jgi:hypothetical protein
MSLTPYACVTVLSSDTSMLKQMPQDCAEESQVGIIISGN